MTDRDWCIMKCDNQRIRPTADDLYNFCERAAIKIVSGGISVHAARNQSFKLTFGVEAQ